MEVVEGRRHVIPLLRPHKNLGAQDDGTEEKTRVEN